MAEAPMHGVYPATPDAHVDDDGTVELIASAPGPAGSSSVELPDGSVWEVDHADPRLLVAIDVPGGDVAGSAVVIAAFGAEEALFLAERAQEQSHVDLAAATRPRSQPFGSSGVMEREPSMGRLVLLADLARDQELDPLPRLAAAVEFAVDVGPTPAGDVLGPLVGPMLDLAERLAADVDDQDLDALDAKLRHMLARAVRSASQGGADRLGLVRLTDRLLASPDEQSWGLAEALPSRPYALDDDMDVSAMEAASFAWAADDRGDSWDSAPKDFMEVKRVAPGLLRVTVARSDRDRWVRVLRRDGLVLLAQSPLFPDGMLMAADLPVPPDTTDEELDVLVVPEADLVVRPGAGESIRAAVRAGRDATRMDRARSMDVAVRWLECADLWELAGDDLRADQARRYAADQGTLQLMRWRRPQPLVDQVVEPEDRWA